MDPVNLDLAVSHQYIWASIWFMQAYIDTIHANTLRVIKVKGRTRQAVFINKKLRTLINQFFLYFHMIAPASV